MVRANGGVKVCRDSGQEVASVGLRGADENSSGAHVVCVGAIVVEPKVVIGDGGEAALGAISELGVGVREAGEGGQVSERSQVGGVCM